MPEQISTFTGNMVAFFRPRKRTFYLLRWNTLVRKWCKYEEECPNLSIHKSSLHTSANAIIHVQRLRNVTANTSVKADGCYLNSGEHNIAILKSDGSIPLNLIGREFTAENATENYLTNIRLWTAREIVPELPEPILTVKYKPIPRNIAWIIAEDACKKNEQCSITLNAISPLTSAVTSCFHVFEFSAIEEWMATHTSCPVCRENCNFTRAYDTGDVY